MTRAAALLLFVLLAACAQPRAAVTIEAGPRGASVSPVMSGNLGGLNVRVSP